MLIIIKVSERDRKREEKKRWVVGEISSGVLISLSNSRPFWNRTDYAEAEQEFDSLIESDPYRLDDMDIFSNVLYVMEKKAKLSYLAHMSSATDKYRSETMCIVGKI